MINTSLLADYFLYSELKLTLGKIICFFEAKVVYFIFDFSKAMKVPDIQWYFLNKSEIG